MGVSLDRRENELFALKDKATAEQTVWLDRCFGKHNWVIKNDETETGRKILRFHFFIHSKWYCRVEEFRTVGEIIHKMEIDFSPEDRHV